MAEISVGGAINEGFSLIRRAPVTVLLWGVTRIALAALAIALYLPVYMAMFEAARSGAGASAFQSMSPQMTQVQGLSYLVNIVQIGIGAVLYCAVWRSVLHPERRQFAYLRVGLPELLVGALILGGSFAFGIGLVIAIIVVAIIIGILVAVHVIWAAVIIGILAVILAIAAAFYFLLRLSMVGPMIVDDGQFHFADAWKLTRGHVGSLFLIGLVVTVILAVAEIVLAILLFAIGAGVLVGLAGGAQNLPAFFQQPPQALIARLGPLLVVFAVIWIPFTGCVMAIMMAPWARAYRDLKPPDIAATFA